ncbi:MAG: RNA polymerase sigma factor [Gemmatimonadota bacterium]
MDGGDRLSNRQVANGPPNTRAKTVRTLDGVDSDTDLLARARNGDAHAFRHLVERYQDGVAAVVVGMLGPGPDADDVGQETFVRFYRSIDRFRGEAALRTYLTRIAMNLSLNELKRRKRRERRVLRIHEGTPEFAAPGEGPDEAVDRADRARAVREAIDRLDEKHRAVVTLRMIQGLSTKETAEALGVPEGTVLSRLARGRQKLEGELKPWLNDDE